MSEDVGRGSLSTDCALLQPPLFLSSTFPFRYLSISKMHIATQSESLTITPLVHDPAKTKVTFGAIVEGVDLNSIDRKFFPSN